MLLRYALRELRNSPRFCILFSISMTLGLLGFISLDALKRSFEDRLQGSAKTLLGADLSVSARRKLQPEELAKAKAALPSGTDSQSLYSLYSMTANGSRSALVELRAIGEGYPYFGSIRLQKSGIHDHRRKLALADSPSVWVAPELLLQLDASIGSPLRIGNKDFVIADVIEEDTATSMGASAAMAPRVYIALNQLQQANLIQAGSTLWQYELYRLPVTADVTSMEALLKDALKDPSIRIRTYTEAGQDNGRMLAYLSDYLGLVSLVALALAAIGAAYLFRDYMERKKTAIATLVSLGMTHTRALSLCMIELSLLGAGSAFFACLISLPLIPLALRFFKSFSPIALDATLPLQSWFLAFLLGIFGAVLICLPLLARLRDLNPSLLFQEQAGSTQLFSARKFIGYIPGILGFYGLAVWQAHSWKIGSLFVLVFLVIISILSLAAWLFSQGAKRLRRHPALVIRFAALNLRSHPVSTMSAFIALGIGSSLINLIPQIQYSLQNELHNPDGERLPSLFLFDIQDEQLDELKGIIKDLGPVTPSPMVMGRLTQVNGQKFSRIDNQDSGTREDERQENSRNRGVNLSYRPQLAKSERITAGKFFNGPYEFDSKQPAEVSLEENYAERVGLKLGDRLTFDIQGLPVEAVVTSLRSVKWNTFEPNFFILLQPGAIDDAPKTHLLSLPDLPIDEKIAMQRKIVQTFPNVSIIDVSKLVAKITEIIGQMSLVLVIMGWLTVATGLFVVFSIAQQQALARRWDHNLMKILGAPFSLLIRANLLEFFSLGLAASLLGSLMGIGASFVIAKGVFRGVWQPSLGLPFGLSIALVSICLITAWVATRRILESRPSLQLDL